MIFPWQPKPIQQSSQGWAGLAQGGTAPTIQHGNLANQAIGGLLAGQAQGQAYQNQMAQNMSGAYTTPLPQFEENVPDDELEFEGKLMRWTQQLFSPTVGTHGIQCCQRMLML